MSKLRVGLILDQGAQSKIVRDFLENSANSPYFDVELLIVQKRSDTNSVSGFGRIGKMIGQRGIRKTLRNAFFKIIKTVEGHLIRRFSDYGGYFDKYDILDFGIDEFHVAPIVSKSGYIYRYSTEDLRAIKDSNLDLLVRGGSGILRGEILNVCRLGVISFHHGDNDLFRGGPPAFWEVFLREPATGFIIQRLKDELDGGDVLFKGKIKTSPIYSLNLVRLYSRSNIFLANLIEHIARSGSAPETYPKVPYCFPLYTTPDLVVQSRYVFRVLFYIVKKVIDKVRNRGVRWNVGYQFVDNWRDVSLRRSNVIDNPRGAFLADPFVLEHDGRKVCFVEEFSYRSKKGVISAYELSGDNAHRLGVVLEEPFHLSYPFLLTVGDEVYMVPESHEAGEIRVYRCSSFPTQWEYSHTILKDVSAADSSIFFRDDKWWLLTNLDSSGGNDHHSELHLFCADSLFATEWQSHPCNPVVFDSRKGRNGGLIIEGDEVFRVFQEYGWDNYGESFGVCRVLELSSKKYSEDEVFRVRPSFYKGINGTHSFSYSSGVVAFDFSRIGSLSD
jgi:hypothetical protein